MSERFATTFMRRRGGASELLQLIQQRLDVRLDRAFVGKTPSAVMAAVLAAEPTPISTLQPLTPPAPRR